MIVPVRNYKLGRGWAGIATVLLLFGFSAARWVLDQLEPGYYYAHRAVPIGVCLLGLIFTLVAGTILNKQRSVYDKVTRRTVTTGGWHTVLGLPIQYWSIAFVILMLVDLAHTAPPP